MFSTTALLPLGSPLLVASTVNSYLFFASKFGLAVRVTTPLDELIEKEPASVPVIANANPLVEPFLSLAVTVYIL